MNISYKWLRSYFEKDLPAPAELASFINSHVFEVEGQQEIGDDVVFDIKVMPDRAHHALCHRGIAREVRALTGIGLISGAEETYPSTACGTRYAALRSDSPRPSQDMSLPLSISGTLSSVSVSIRAPKLCRRYVARRIENVKIAESPAWLREKLEAIGARSINTIVDATNFVMYDIGQPLHAFDADKVKGGIVVRLANKGEKIELLPERVLVEDGGTKQWVEKERVLELKETDLVIADDLGPIAIAGVKGGRRAEISASTKNLILESANFDPVSVRRTSTRLNIRNDSSKRFENEIIPELAIEAMEQLTSLIVELSNNDILVGKIADEFNAPTKPWTVVVLAGFVGEKIGLDVSHDEFKKILSLFDCSFIEKGKTEDGAMLLEITPPLYRLDLKIPEDFVDEVARVKGYDGLKTILPPKIDSQISDNTAFYWSEKIKNALVESGYSEALLYSLVSKGFFEIEYPLASDKSALRESIAPKMKEALSTNSLNADLLGLDVIKMYEIGKVFPKTGEKLVLCIGVKNVKKSKKKEPEIISETLNDLSDVLGVKFEAKPIDGIVEIDLDALIANLPKSGSASELSFRALPRDQRYAPFSTYPFIVRDIAVFVTENIQAEQVWEAIEKGTIGAGALGLLVRKSLFDVFKKDGKVSYAYRMVFQSKERTLTDDEANKIMESVYGEMKKSGWEVR